MVNFPSVSKSSLNNLSPSSTSSGGHIFMYSLLVFVLLGIIVIVSTILYFTSNRKRRKYSKPDASNEHETGPTSRVVQREEKSFVKLTSFPTSITPVQVNRYSPSTSSTSSSVEETERDGGSYWRYDAAHSSTCPITDEGEQSNAIGSPKLTFSLRVDSGAISSKFEGNFPREAEEREIIQLNLVQGYNLRRSYVDQSSKTFSPLTSPSEGSLFEAEGIVARIFPSKKIDKISSGVYHSRYGTGAELLDTRASGDEGRSSDGKEVGSCDGENVIETRMIRSRRSKDVSFNELESIRLEKFQFPVRITVYEVDRNGVRFSLGHTYIVLPPNLDTFHVKTNKLYSTIYRAKNAIKLLK